MEEYMITKPYDIEKTSLGIIADELAQRHVEVSQENLPVLMRVIHTTADFDYAENLVFSHGVAGTLKCALKQGCHIVTDTTMGMSGINKRALARLSCEVHCYMGDEDVAAAAVERGTTRAVASMEKASRLCRENGWRCIYAIGNAPTALMELCRQIRAGELDPVAVIGVPVGFVNVVESKEMLLGLDVPYIVARGRKGGSNVAAAICNALLYEVAGR
jgi:precorrin-8X/cobalt-precorrin-8 methylmutase